MNFFRANGGKTNSEITMTKDLPAMKLRTKLMEISRQKIEQQKRQPASFISQKDPAMVIQEN